MGITKRGNVIWMRRMLGLLSLVKINWRFPWQVEVWGRGMRDNCRRKQREARVKNGYYLRQQRGNAQKEAQKERELPEHSGGMHACEKRGSGHSAHKLKVILLRRIFIKFAPAFFAFNENPQGVSWPSFTTFPRAHVCYPHIFRTYIT